MSVNSNDFSDKINVSVIIPNYNYDQYLGQCLQSALDSDFDRAEMEIIVVDDASTDESVKVIEEMMKSSRFPFRLIKNETNLGLILSRNRGIANARGEFLFFLDSDNYIRKDCLKIHAAVLQQNPDATACYAPIQNFLNKTGEYCGIRSNRPFDYQKLLEVPGIDAMAMFRKKDLIETGLFDNKMPPYGWEDFELWLRLGRTGRHVVFIGGEPLSFYRTHALNMSQNYQPDQFNHLVYYLKQKYPISLPIKQSETLDSLIYPINHSYQIEIKSLISQVADLRDELITIKGSFFYKLAWHLSLVNPVRFVRRIKENLSITKNIRLIRGSGFFDVEYYLQNNPDVRDSGMDAVKHYLLYGGFEGRNPSEKFDSSFYLENNPDVKASGMNPMVHFIMLGKKENRKYAF